MSKKDETNFNHFRKLQARYWLQSPLPDPNDLVKEFTKKISNIENKEFGVSEDTYIVTTQAKLVLNGLALKIFYFMKHSIIYVENKQYISSIALLRLCLEHLVMLSHFEGKLTNYIEKKDHTALQVLLHSFSMGERIFYVDIVDKHSGRKVFSSRAEHVNEALRFFDQKYQNYGLGVQLLYDLFSNHSHVTPTSALRMLYRQKIWNKSEPNADFRNMRISTESNSHEKLACGGIELIQRVLEVVEEEVLSKEPRMSEELEKTGRVIELNLAINPNSNYTLNKLLSGHDKLARNFLSKIEKYGKPKP